MLHSAASNRGLHCLLRHFSPYTESKHCSGWNSIIICSFKVWKGPLLCDVMCVCVLGCFFSFNLVANLSGQNQHKQIFDVVFVKFRLSFYHFLNVTCRESSKLFIIGKS